MDMFGLVIFTLSTGYNSSHADFFTLSSNVLHHVCFFLRSQRGMGLLKDCVEDAGVHV